MDMEGTPGAQIRVMNLEATRRRAQAHRAGREVHGVWKLENVRW